MIIGLKCFKLFHSRKAYTEGVRALCLKDRRVILVISIPLEEDGGPKGGECLKQPKNSLTFPVSFMYYSLSDDRLSIFYLLI